MRNKEKIKALKKNEERWKSEILFNQYLIPHIIMMKNK